MCRVSSRFNQIAVPILYHDINLGSLKRASICCAALLGVSAASRRFSVRSLVICTLDGDRESELDDLLLLRRMLLIPRLEQALPMLVQLEHLHLWLPSYDDNLLDVLEKATLPHLQRFGCHQPGPTHDALLTSFLDRHAEQLTHLEIIRPYAFRFDNIALKTEPTPFLPSLHSYRGSTSYFRHIRIPANRLEHASFWDVPAWANLHDLFIPLAAVASVSTRTPFSLRFLWDGPRDEMLDMLSAQLPGISSVELAPFCSSNVVAAVEGMVDRVAKSLERSTHLVSFSLDNCAQIILSLQAENPMRIRSR
ncbi:hypothetical protein C8R43DRAFT_1237091 [Mycena crocata]|nr:hypothetical protein C8R43DRAFT_1237091 [Mycena crocata]